MAAPTMSYLICSMALVALIIVMPSIFTIQRDSISQEMAQRELTEIADYTSNTLANLFFLANSTQIINVNMTKDLLYLPKTVQDNTYVLRIVSSEGDASAVTAHLKDKPLVMGSSWLVPGLRVSKDYSIEIGGRSVVAGCYRSTDGFYLWLGWHE